MKARTWKARRAQWRVRVDRWRWRLASWIMRGVYGGPGSRPVNSLTVYSSPSGAVYVTQRPSNALVGVSVYEAGARARAETGLTAQQAASLADALLYWVQHGTLPERIANFGDLGNPNVCPHGWMICYECRDAGPESGTVPHSE